MTHQRSRDRGPRTQRFPAGDSLLWEDIVPDFICICICICMVSRRVKAIVLLWEGCQEFICFCIWICIARCDFCCLWFGSKLLLKTVYCLSSIVLLHIGATNDGGRPCFWGNFLITATGPPPDRLLTIEQFYNRLLSNTLNTNTVFVRDSVTPRNITIVALCIA